MFGCHAVQVYIYMSVYVCQICFLTQLSSPLSLLVSFGEGHPPYIYGSMWGTPTPHCFSNWITKRERERSFCSNVPQPLFCMFSKFLLHVPPLLFMWMGPSCHDSLCFRSSNQSKSYDRWELVPPSSKPRLDQKAKPKGGIVSFASKPFDIYPTNFILCLITTHWINEHEQK